MPMLQDRRRGVPPMLPSLRFALRPSHLASSLILATCLLTGVTSVNAGPNADGTLILHTNPSVVWTVDPTNYCGGSGLATCSEAINSVQGSATSVVFAIAAFPPSSSPRLAGITFGVNYPSIISIVSSGSCGDFEFAGDGWPSPLTGTAVTFISARTTVLVECYWFAAYNYYGSLQSGSLWLIPHPSLGGSFADDSVPSIVDGISAYGSLGFDEPGYTPCPQVSLPGACCFPDGSCIVETVGDCLGHGGIHQGEGTTCLPNPCPQPIGACCLQDLTCVDVIAAECASLGGTFLGLGIPCDPNPCGTLTLDDDGVPNAWASDPDTLTALLRDHVGEVVPAYPVVLSVASGPNATLTLGPTLTDPDGVATFSYDNPSESTGTDVLQAFTVSGVRDTPIASNLAVAPKVRAKVEVEIPNNKTTLPGFPTTVLVYVTNESDVPISGEVRVDMDPADVVPMDDPDPPWPVENLAPGDRKGPFKLLARTCKKVGTPISAAFYLDKPEGPKKLASLPQNPLVTLVPRTEPIIQPFKSIGGGAADKAWAIEGEVRLTPIEQNGQFTSIDVAVYGGYYTTILDSGETAPHPSHITIDHPKAGTKRNARALHSLNCDGPTPLDECDSGNFGGWGFAIPCHEAIALSSNPIEVKFLGISKDGEALTQHAKWTGKETIIAKKTGQLVAVPQWDIAATIPVANSGLLPVDVELTVTEIAPNWSIELVPSVFSLEPEEVRFISVKGMGSGDMNQGFPILVDEVHPATTDTLRWEIPVLLEREFEDEIVVNDSLAFSFCLVTVRGGIHLTSGGILDVSSSLVHCAEEGLAVLCDPGGKLGLNSSVLSAVNGDGVVLQGTTSLRSAVIAGFNQGVVQAGGHVEVTSAQIDAVGTAFDVSACDTTSFVVLPSVVSGTGPAIRVSNCPSLVLAGPSVGIVGAPLVVNESNINLRSPVFPVEDVQTDGTSTVDISYLLGFQVIGPDSSGIEGADVTVTSHDSVVLVDDWVTDANGMTSRLYVTLARIDGSQLEYASPLSVELAGAGETWTFAVSVERDSVITLPAWDFAVAATDPSPGTVGADWRPTIGVSFSRPALASDLTGRFRVTGSVSGPAPGNLNVSPDGWTAEFTPYYGPTRVFAAGELVDSEILRTVRSALEDTIAAPYAWQFRTGAHRGDGTFLALPALSPQSSAVALVAGDLGGDWRLEMIACGTDGKLAIFRNVTLEGGQPAWQLTTLTLGTSLSSVLLLDVTGDGRLDILASDQGLNVIHVGRNNGDGTSWTWSTWPTGVGPQRLVAGDFNGDGLSDVAVCNEAAGGVHIVLGDGSAGYSDIGIYTVADNPFDLGVGDLDLDGDLDLVVLHGSAEQITVLRNVNPTASADAIFALDATREVHETKGLLVEDMNGDGRPDIIVASADQVAILLTDQEGTPGPPVFYSSNSPGTTALRGIAPLDFDGDGDQDLAVTNPDTDLWILLTNDGLGALSVASSTATQTRPILPLTVDVNRDGLMDVVVPTRIGRRLEVFLGNRHSSDVESDSASPLREGIWISAHPNPVTASTYFRVGGQGSLRLEIFDSGGRRVRTFDLPAESGAQRGVSWDGTVGAGRLANTGLYFARLTGSEGARTTRVILIR